MAPARSAALPPSSEGSCTLHSNAPSPAAPAAAAAATASQGAPAGQPVLTIDLNPDVDSSTVSSDSSTGHTNMDHDPMARAEDPMNRRHSKRLSAVLPPPLPPPNRPLPPPPGGGPRLAPGARPPPTAYLAASPTAIPSFNEFNLPRSDHLVLPTGPVLSAAAMPLSHSPLGRPQRSERSEREAYLTSALQFPLDMISELASPSFQGSGSDSRPPSRPPSRPASPSKSRVGSFLTRAKSSVSMRSVSAGAESTGSHSPQPEMPPLPRTMDRQPPSAYGPGPVPVRWSSHGGAVHHKASAEPLVTAGTDRVPAARGRTRSFSTGAQPAPVSPPIRPGHLLPRSTAATGEPTLLASPPRALPTGPLEQAKGGSNCAVTVAPRPSDGSPPVLVSSPVHHLPPSAVPVVPVVLRHNPPSVAVDQLSPRMAQPTRPPVAKDKTASSPAPGTPRLPAATHSEKLPVAYSPSRTAPPRGPPTPPTQNIDPRSTNPPPSRSLPNAAVPSATPGPTPSPSTDPRTPHVPAGPMMPKAKPHNAPPQSLTLHRNPSESTHPERRVRSPSMANHSPASTDSASKESVEPVKRSFSRLRSTVTWLHGRRPEPMSIENGSPQIYQHQTASSSTTSKLYSALETKLPVMSRGASQVAVQPLTSKRHSLVNHSTAAPLAAYQLQRQPSTSHGHGPAQIPQAPHALPTPPPDATSSPHNIFFRPTLPSKVSPPNFAPDGNANHSPSRTVARLLPVETASRGTWAPPQPSAILPPLISPRMSQSAENLPAGAPQTKPKWINRIWPFGNSDGISKVPTVDMPQSPSTQRHWRDESARQRVTPTSELRRSHSLTHDPSPPRSRFGFSRPHVADGGDTDDKQRKRRSLIGIGLLSLRSAPGDEHSTPDVAHTKEYSGDKSTTDLIPQPQISARRRSSSVSDRIGPQVIPVRSRSKASSHSRSGSASEIHARLMGTNAQQRPHAYVAVGDVIETMLPAAAAK